MKLAKLKVSNYILFKELELDFITKRKYKEGNFDPIYLVENKKILSKIGIIGKNASGKSRIISIFELINFLLSTQSVFNFLKIMTDSLILLSMNYENIIDKKSWEIKNLQYLDVVNDFKKIVIKKWKNILSKYNYDENENIIIKLDFVESKTKTLEINICCDYPKFKIMVDKNIDEINLLDTFIEHNFNKPEYLPLLSFEDLKKIYEKACLPELINFIDYDIKNFFNVIQVYNNEYVLSNLISNKKINNIILNNFIKKIKNFNEEEKNKQIERLLKWIQITDPSIRSVIFDDTKSYQFKSFINYKNQEIDIDGISDGTKKWIFLFNILFYSDSKFFVIDEIENSLHAKLVKFIFEVIYQENKQIIFTTHNPLVFNKKFRPDSLYYLENDIDNEYKMHKLCDNKVVERSNSIKEMIEKEIIGEHPDVNKLFEFLENNSKYEH